MAVTVTRKPFSIAPAYNDAWFTATSNQTAQVNFKYYVKVTINSITYNFPINATPAGTLEFNAYDLVKDIVTNYYPFGLTGWQVATGAFNNYVINIGEEYGNPVAYFAGANSTHYVWNASLTRNERAIYIPDAYCSNTAIIPLNSLGNSCVINKNQDLVFYFLNTGAIVDKVRVETFNAAGASLGSYDIANPIVSSATSNQLVCINVGTTGLTNIPSGLVTVVTGVLPIITNSVASYTLNFNGLDAVPTAYSWVHTVTITEPFTKYDNNCVFYLNRFGAFDYINMYGNPQRELMSQKSYFKGVTSLLDTSHLNTGGANVLGVKPYSISKKVFNNTYENKLVLKSEALSQAQIDRLADLKSGANTFISNSWNDYARYNCEDSKYEPKNIKREKLVYLELTLTDGITERRQNT